MVESTKTTKKSKPQHTVLSNKSVAKAAKPKTSKYPYTFTTDKKRAEALELPGTCTDTITNYLARNPEKYFVPKEVHSKNDWLACKLEPG